MHSFMLYIGLSFREQPFVSTISHYTFTLEAADSTDQSSFHATANRNLHTVVCMTRVCSKVWGKATFTDMQFVISERVI